MQKKPRRFFGAVCATLAVAVTACGSSSNKSVNSGATATTVGQTSTGVTTSPGAAGNSAQGVTASTVTIGFITSETGGQAPVFSGAQAGCTARVDAQNAQGGVNGRKVIVDFGDDQSSYTGLNSSLATNLAQTKHVFLVGNDSGAGFLTYRALEGLGVPMLTYGDNNYVGAPGNQNFTLATSGNTSIVPGITYDGGVRIMKAMGATKIAVVGYGAFSPSSKAQAENTQKAVVDAGLKAVYTNTTVTYADANLGPVVLGIKNSGADGLYLPMAVNTDIALIQGLQQAGVKMKSVVSLQGYGQDLLDSSAAKSLGPEDVFVNGWAPVELNNAATQKFQADLSTYAHISGAPGFGPYTGYEICDLAILGLQHAGNPPTRASFMTNLRQLGTTNLAGLACAPVDISLQNYGKSPSQTCSWALYAQDGKWHIYPASGAPWISKVIPSSAPAGTTFTAAQPYFTAQQ